MKNKKQSDLKQKFKPQLIQPVVHTKPIKPPKFEHISNSHLKETETSTISDLAPTLGVADEELAIHFLNQIMNTSAGWTNSKASHCNHALALIHGMNPKDTFETMLCVQIVAVHENAMKMLCLANAENTPHERSESYHSRAIKLMRTYAQLLDALNKHRGKGQQKVTVEHVTVNRGGQAIVGNLSHEGGGN